MSWRRVLLDIPALLFTLWWTAYRLVLILVVMIVGTVTGLSLALAALGIRWGW
jgi:hypothetical protein